MDATNLAHLPIFAGLAAEDLGPLAAASYIQDYEAGGCVFLEGEALASAFPILLRGSVQLTKISVAGRETILRLLGPGEIFAWAALLDGGPAPATARLLAPSEVLFLPRQELLGLMAARPELALRVLIELSERLRELHERFHDVASERARTRVARLLLRFERTEDGRVTTRLPHETLSRMAGITYDESVRILRGWSEAPRPILRYQRGGRVTLLDPAQLRAIAHGEDT